MSRNRPLRIPLRRFRVTKFRRTSACAKGWSECCENKLASVSNQFGDRHECEDDRAAAFSRCVGCTVAGRAANQGKRQWRTTGAEVSRNGRQGGERRRRTRRSGPSASAALQRLHDGYGALIASPRFSCALKNTSAGSLTRRSAFLSRSCRRSRAPPHQQRQRRQLPRGPRHAHQQRACVRGPMSAAACPIAATFAAADSVGAAPASESAAATTAPITIERIQSLLGSPTKQPYPVDAL